MSSRAILFAVTLAAIAVTGCSSLVSPSSSVSFSAADAQIVAKQFASGANNGVSAGSSQSTRAASPFGISPLSLLSPQQVSCNSSGTSCQLFQQYSQTTNCTSGGRMSSSGQMSGSVSIGTLGPFGSISMTQTDSIVSWTCDGGWTINGDPYLSDTGTITMTGSHTSFSFRQGGGISAVATTGERVSCLPSVTVTWDSSLGGSFSGSITCNPGGTYSVSGSF